MAKSGSFKTGAYEGRYLLFSWSQASQSIENNTTTINWTLKGAGGSSGMWYYCQNVKCVIDGKTVYQKADQFKLYDGTTVASGSYTFTHNDTGARSFTASAEAGIYVWAVNCTGSGSFDLETIARASQPSCITWPEHTQNVGYFGDEVAIHMNRKSSAFTHTVRYAFGSKSGTIATKVTTGTTWVLPLSFMDLLPAATSGSGTIYVDTYNGSTLVGTKYCGFTAKVPASVVPSCKLTLEDITGVDDIYGSPVQNLSKIKITVGFTSAYSSPLASCKITADGATYTGTSATTGALKNSGSSVIKATVTDERGRTASASYTMTVQPYNAPVISLLAVHRCSADGTDDDQGAYIRINFSASVTSLGSKNTATYSLKYKKSANTSYSTVSLTALKNNFSVSNYEHIISADVSTSYDITVTVTDRHNTATRSTSASTAFSLLDLHSSGTGLRFGGVAERENTFRNDLALQQVGNTFVYQPSGFSGTKGFSLMAVITITELNVDAPIVFVLNQRAALCPMTVYVRFASSSSTTDPALSSISYEGDNYGAFLVKASTSTWKLYASNSTGWANTCLQSWYTTENQKARLNVTFAEEQIAGTDPSVLGTYYRATPAKLQSLLDFIYPVGSIYLSYSHVDPGTLFGGTWARLSNNYLWATSATGTIGQTGAMYTPTAGKSWTYIQISAWRRTA